MEKTIYTHKGWLGIAPIYLSYEHTDIVERRFCGWLLSFSIWAVQTINDVFDTEYPFPIKVTGKLKKPYVLFHD